MRGTGDARGHAQILPVTLSLFFITGMAFHKDNGVVSALLRLQHSSVGDLKILRHIKKTGTQPEHIHFATGTTREVEKGNFYFFPYYVLLAPDNNFKRLMLDSRVLLEAPTTNQQPTN